VIKRDLEAGAEIQSSLLPQSASMIYRVRFDSIFLPSAYVAGDIFNYFKLDENHVGFYVLDVAGHGIPAAMLSVSLSKVLSPTNHQECLLKQFMPVPEPPYYEIINPANAMRALNERFQADEDTMQYFTMIYGLIDIRDGRTVMTQAGHPPPIFLQEGKKAILIGTGGYPVGMLPDLDYEEKAVHMDNGDRLILYSDGITECTNNEKEQFSVERFIKLLEEGHDLPLRELMERIKDSLRLWKGGNQFEDDVTLLAMEMV
jgi:sigma-B regulation protein RsbU (phosphoserine phosphatase)